MATEPEIATTIAPTDDKEMPDRLSRQTGGRSEDEQDSREAQRLLARINLALNEAHARADRLLARL